MVYLNDLIVKTFHLSTVFIIITFMDCVVSNLAQQCGDNVLFRTMTYVFFFLLAYS